MLITVNSKTVDTDHLDANLLEAIEFICRHHGVPELFRPLNGIAAHIEDLSEQIESLTDDVEREESNGQDRQNEILRIQKKIETRAEELETTDIKRFKEILKDIAYDIGILAM